MRGQKQDCWRCRRRVPWCGERRQARWPDRLSRLLLRNVHGLQVPKFDAMRSQQPPGQYTSMLGDPDVITPATVLGNGMTMLGTTFLSEANPMVIAVVSHRGHGLQTSCGTRKGGPKLTNTQQCEQLADSTAVLRSIPIGGPQKHTLRIKGV